MSSLVKFVPQRESSSLALFCHRDRRRAPRTMVSSARSSNSLGNGSLWSLDGVGSVLFAVSHRWRHTILWLHFLGSINTLSQWFTLRKPLLTLLERKISRHPFNVLGKDANKVGFLGSFQSFRDACRVEGTLIVFKSSYSISFTCIIIMRSVRFLRNGWIKHFEQFSHYFRAKRSFTQRSSRACRSNLEIVHSAHGKMHDTRRRRLDFTEKFSFFRVLSF